MNHRTKNRVRKIEEFAFETSPKVVVISIENGETKDDAMEKYFKEHPEDRGVLNVYVTLRK
jgi:hypothetical protein